MIICRVDGRMRTLADACSVLHVPAYILSGDVRIDLSRGRREENINVVSSDEAIEDGEGEI